MATANKIPDHANRGTFKACRVHVSTLDGPKPPCYRRSNDGAGISYIDIMYVGL